VSSAAEDIVPAAARRRARRWLVVAGVAVALWGGFALWKAFEIPQPTAYRPMGPRVFPVMISVALIVLGVLFVIETLRGADEAVEQHVVDEHRTADHRQAAIIVGLLIGYAFLFERVGYVVTTMVFFPAVSRVLGSRRPLRDVIVGVIVSVAAFTVFTELLSIDLPEGVMP
jgi:putative tricarboxylic transport membrane protein